MRPDVIFIVWYFHPLMLFDNESTRWYCRTHECQTQWAL